MSYLALYRKYRPRNFDDFAGQDEITNALRYQVKSSTFGHSYIFSGIRGTGKTSMAKVFARSVNCLNLIDGNACCECESCIASLDNSLLDIVEIDAASNNGVDDIRSIRENAMFLPAYSKYKVYIIDEIQMLSSSAFNALLKILEEPPDKVIFIMATTQIHKIPDTILSRAQKYIFRRIDEKSIVNRLSFICENENILFEKEALYLISSQCEGSLRDAISYMEKTLPEARGNITHDAVVKSLGLIGAKRTDLLFNSIINNDIAFLIKDLSNALEEGKEIDMIFKEFLGFLRALVIDRHIKNSDLIFNLTAINISRYREKYKDISEDKLVKIMDIFSSAWTKLRYSKSPNLVFEMAAFEVASLFDKRKVQIIKKEPTKDIVETKVEVKEDKIYSEKDDKNIISIFTKKISLENKELANLLNNKDIELKGDIINITVMGKDFKDFAILNLKENINILESILKEITGKETKVKLEIKSDLSTEEKLERLFGEI